VAITCRSDEDWRRLRGALGEPEWAMKLELESADGRFAAQDELDAKLSEWTSGQTKMSVTSTLQMFCVPAAPMLTATDQILDPHYQVRGYLRWIHQQDLGWMCMEGPAFRASGMKDVNLFQAPLLGEHTRTICRDLLDMQDEEIEKLVAAGTLEVPQESS
jgi:crotonobetainyl-CoA:carnitine CoA-transferase CaiB-like acyl-CoA transferase